MKNNEQVENYYDEKYFHSYQKEIGEFGGMANLFKFKINQLFRTEHLLDAKTIKKTQDCVNYFILVLLESVPQVVRRLA